jgi:gamma-glutamyltranspeptidase/glutathione hydrolase
VRRLAPAVVALAVAASVAHARPGAVATEHRDAAAAGAAMRRAAGSAPAAAIAAAAAVCVVHASSCGIGGGGFALVVPAGAPPVALDFRERAAAAVTAALFQRDGRPQPELLRRGGLAVAVPGEVAGWVALHRRFGRLPLAQVLAPAVRLARDGFPLARAPHLAAEIARQRDLLGADPTLARVFLDGGTLPGPTFTVVQPELAATLEAVGEAGTRAVYAGPRAAAMVAAVRAAGGVLTAADLAAYRPAWRRPLERPFRGRRVVTFPPPGSGGVVLEALGIVARDDLVALGADTATSLHLLAGALAQAFADRARWYGDPACTDVPIGALLASPRLAALRAGLRATGVTAPRALPARDAGTAHVSVVDGDGNAVALTTTINTGFGAGIAVPGTGIVLNNEMDDFVLGADVPNVYGLTGGAANVPAPGKRPQSSMSPTIVLVGRRPELVVGGSGGPTIISGTVQVLLGVVAYGRDLRAAVDAPRIHDQGTPAVLGVEPGIPPVVRAALGRLGHTVREWPAIGAVSAVGLDPDGTPSAAGDMRKDGGDAIVR